MTEEEITIYHNGKPVSILNPRLIELRNINKEGIAKLLDAHSERLAIEDLMVKAIGSNIKSLYQRWRETEFLLQDLWGFERNENYFRSWHLPGCVCAKDDNDLAYPTGYYSHRLDCPIHGEVE